MLYSSYPLCALSWGYTKATNQTTNPSSIHLPKPRLSAFVPIHWPSITTGPAFLHLTSTLQPRSLSTPSTTCIVIADGARPWLFGSENKETTKFWLNKILRIRKIVWGDDGEKKEKKKCISWIVQGEPEAHLSLSLRVFFSFNPVKYFNATMVAGKRACGCYP